MNTVRTRLDSLATKLMASKHAVKKTLTALRANGRPRGVPPRTWAMRGRAVLPLLAYAAGWAAALYATSALAAALSPKIEGPSPLHFQDAVTVAALLLAPRRRWWPYLVLIVPLTLMDFWLLGLTPSAAVVWVILTLYVVVGGISVLTVSLLRQFVAAPLRLAGVGEVGRFVTSAAVAAVPAAVIATALRTFVFSWDFWVSWQVAYLGHVLGIVVF